MFTFEKCTICDCTFLIYVIRITYHISQITWQMTVHKYCPQIRSLTDHKVHSQITNPNHISLIQIANHGSPNHMSKSLIHITVHKSHSTKSGVCSKPHTNSGVRSKPPNCPLSDLVAWKPCGFKLSLNPLHSGVQTRLNPFQTDSNGSEPHE